MEKQIDAFFYNFKYYVFPQEYGNAKDIGQGAVIKAKRLKEERCMAPDFIYESIEDETLTIDRPEMLFPVKVNIYSGEEYDKILSKRVDEVCPGCLRYIDDGKPSLEGHHREISLDGVCYERKTRDGKISYATRVFWFYSELEKHLDELAECIDGKNAKKFDKICKECARVIESPVRFVGDIKDGKYRISMEAGFGSDLYYALLCYIADVGALENRLFSKSGWIMHPYISEGTACYKSKLKDTQKIVFAKEYDDAPRFLEIAIYCQSESEKKRNALIWDLHRNLSYKIGESAILRTVGEYKFTSNKEGLISVKELSEIIRKKDDEFKDTNSFPSTKNISWEAEEKALPYRRNSEGISVCYTLSDLASNVDSIGEINFGDELAFAYIFVPSNDDEFSSKISVVGDYLHGEANVPEPLRDAEDYMGSFKGIGVFGCYDDDGRAIGLAFDCIVFDEKAFFRFVRTIAPVLSFYAARIVVVNGNGVNEYLAGYEIVPADDSIKN